MINNGENTNCKMQLFLVAQPKCLFLCLINMCAYKSQYVVLLYVLTAVFM